MGTNDKVGWTRAGGYILTCFVAWSWLVARNQDLQWTSRFIPCSAGVTLIQQRTRRNVPLPPPESLELHALDVLSDGPRRKQMTTRVEDPKTAELSGLTTEPLSEEYLLRLDHYLGMGYRITTHDK